jgi:transglutaminase-like putative cysteine protease
VVYIAAVHNGSYGLTKLVVYQSRPIGWDAQKNVKIEVVSPTPTRKGTDPTFGNGIYYWLVKNAPRPGSSKQFKIQFTFTAYETLTEVNPDTIRPYNKSAALYKLYTRPEKYIESSDPAIVNKANEIAGDVTNPYILARRFYDYVIENVTYKEAGKPGSGAKAMLTYRQGDCGDYSSLFVALARAKGIPARHVVGYWAVSGIDQVHVWAEFYLEGVGWIPVDATVGQVRNRDYYFGNMDNQRVILNKGLNFPLDPPAPGHILATHLQTPTWWFWGTSGNARTLTIERTAWAVTPLG